MIKSRKIIKSFSKITPIKLSYCKLPNNCNPLRISAEINEICNGYSYQKRMNLQFQGFKSQPETI